MHGPRLRRIVERACSHFLVDDAACRFRAEPALDHVHHPAPPFQSPVRDEREGAREAPGGIAAARVLAPAAPPGAAGEEPEFGRDLELYLPLVLPHPLLELLVAQ